MEFPGARTRVIAIAIVLTSATLSSLVTGGDAHAPQELPDFLIPQSLAADPQSISPGVLASYYEHGREHAPPRRPGGAMQRREYFYRAPAEPFELLASKLGAAQADRVLAAEISQLNRSWTKGIPFDVRANDSLRDHATQSSLSAETLLEAARGLQWLISEDAAAPFVAAGLSKACTATEVGRLSPSQASHLLHDLDQTACLWRYNEPSALVCRFTVARRLTPPLSIESRRAGYLLAESLLNEEHRDEAANLILQVRDEHTKVGDLGRYEVAEISEMNFVTGFILFNAGRLGDAIRYLSVVNGEHMEDASSLLVEAYVRTSDFRNAQRMLRTTVVPTQQPFQPTPIAADLKDEMDRARWRAEIGLNPDPPR